MDGWKMSFLLGFPIFRGYVKLRGGNALLVVFFFFGESQTENLHASSEDPGTKFSRGFFGGRVAEGLWWGKRRKRFLFEAMGASELESCSVHMFPEPHNDWNQSFTNLGKNYGKLNQSVNFSSNKKMDFPNLAKG